jgi:hypothetical protein
MTLRRQGQKGQTLVIFAFAAVALVGLASIAVDQGMAQADRRDIQAAADGASLAGTRQYSLGGTLSNVHFVAMEYLVAALGGSTGSCGLNTCAGDGPWTVGAYSFTFTDNGQTLDVSAAHTRQNLIAGAIGASTETVGTSARARPVASSIIGGGLNVAALDGTYQVNGAGTCNPSGQVTGNVYSFGTFGSNNNGNGTCHTIGVPSQLSGLDNSSPPKVVVCQAPAPTQVSFGGDITVNTGGWYFTADTNTIHPGNPSANAQVHYNVPRPLAYDGTPPRPPGGTFTPLNMVGAKDLSGNWNPGTYDGFMPASGPGNLGKFNGGVYRIRNVANPDLSKVTQLNSGTPGAPDGSSAVAFVVDSTDSGDVTLASHNTTTLNGFEGTAANSDTVGTHNFVLYGGPSNDSGSTLGFQGNIAFMNSTDVPVYTGIIYMPNSTMITKGNLGYQFDGAVYMKSFTLDGGGNNGQGFQYICGLGAIEARTIDGALIR